VLVVYECRCDERLNDFLGEIIIPLDVMYFGQVVDKWYDLESRQGKDDEVSGSIHLQIVMTEGTDYQSLGLD